MERALAVHGDGELVSPVDREDAAGEVVERARLRPVPEVDAAVAAARVDGPHRPQAPARLVDDARHQAGSPVRPLEVAAVAGFEVGERQVASVLDGEGGVDVRDRLPVKGGVARSQVDVAGGRVHLRVAERVVADRADERRVRHVHVVEDERAAVEAAENAVRDGAVGERVGVRALVDEVGIPRLAVDRRDVAERARGALPHADRHIAVGRAAILGQLAAPRVVLGREAQVSFGQADAPGARQRSRELDP